MKISVIIPVYNAENSIEKCLKAILEQKETDFDLEIVAVNDGSTDNTAKVLESLTGQIKIISQANQGPAAARNAGAKAANGEVLIFTDSDTVPQPGWVKRIYQTFKEEEVAACAGSYCIANPESPLSRIIQSEIDFRYSSYGKSIKFAGTYNLAVAKNLFFEVGGFDESYRQASGEDNDFCYKVVKAGHLIRFVKEAQVAHYHTENLYKYLKEQFRHGFWRAGLYWQHPDRMSGDDYTYWKDIVEPPLCLATFASLLSSLFPRKSAGRVLGLISMLTLIALFFLELWQAQKFNLAGSDKFFAAKVMFLRAFARTTGFLYGFVKLSGRLKCKKKSA